MRRNRFKLSALLVAVAVLFTSCGGSTAREDAAATSDETTKPSMETEEGYSHGEVLEVPEGMEVPTVEIEVTEDAMAGYNVFVEVENFEIAPERASSEPVDGQGHLHLYIDGKRTQRFYNTALHLDGLEAGEHTIEVEVSANNHSAYAIDGEAIRASETITVEGSDEMAMDAEGVEVDTANAPAVAIDVVADPKSGWNVKVDLENYTLAPENASGENIAGKGHMHLTVDGEKLTRLYGQWWHIAELDEGKHTVEVSLNANNHAPYLLNGEAIVATQEIEVTAEQAKNKGHGSHDKMEMKDGHSASGENVLDIAADEADTVVEVTIKDGQITVTPESPIKVAKGTSVGVKATSDIEEEIHVHTYDILAAIGPDEETDFAFAAEIDGQIEVELERTGSLLFNFQIS